jgi:hypothetical protein
LALCLNRGLRVFILHRYVLKVSEEIDSVILEALKAHGGLALTACLNNPRCDTKFYTQPYSEVEFDHTPPEGTTSQN